MNTHPERPQAEAWLVAELAALPDPPPPDRLYGRILASRQRRRRHSRLYAVAALLVLGALIWPLLDAGRLGEGPAPLTEVSSPDPLPALPPAASALLHIDRQLQAAYDRGADPAQITTLWRVRERIVEQNPKQEPAHEHILSL